MCIGVLVLFFSINRTTFNLGRGFSLPKFDSKIFLDQILVEKIFSPTQIKRSFGYLAQVILGLSGRVISPPPQKKRAFFWGGGMFF